jgi:MFS family permease
MGSVTRSTRASRTEPTPATQRTRRVLLASLMVSMALAAMEGTITATAVPSIAEALGSVELGAWVFAGFLLAQAVTTPLYGAIADRIGRRPVLLTGIAVFLAGALASGFASTMVALVCFRIVQGAGAGAIHSTVSTLAGDLYPLEQRGRIQALLSSVWGLSAIAGPLLGAAAVEIVGWPWVFWFNVPVGVLAMVGIAATLRERVEPVARRLDVMGGLSVFLATGALMVGVTLWGEGGGAAGLALVAAGAVLLSLFVVHARRTAAPFIPVELFADRFLRRANLATFAGGVLTIAFMAYVPGYVQHVLRAPPLIAGFAFTSLSIGWPIAAFVSGRWLVTHGIVRPARSGGALTLVGGVMLALLPTVGSPLWAGAASLVTGLGFGMLLTALTVATQTVVPWSMRAVATSTNMLMRHMGSALGAAVLGAVFTAWHRATVAAPEAVVADGIAQGSTAVFYLAAVVGAVVCVLAWRIPRRALRAPRGDGGS